MDPGEEPPPLPLSLRRTCSCSCLCCGAPSSAWRRSLKRKLHKEHEDDDDDDVDEEDEKEERRIEPALSVATSAVEGVARVEIENEAAALREALGSHQQSMQDLYSELEAERNAAATAASEAMSMILRLQREKAEALMDARQFKRFAEEKMAHDQQEIATLEDLLFKREQAIQSLSCEVQAYKYRLLSYGIVDSNNPNPPSEPQTPEAGAGNVNQSFDLPAFNYPPLRCVIPPGDVDSMDDTADKYPFGETPREHFQKLEQRIYQLERNPSSSRFSNAVEKGVVGQSPRRPRHLRKFSTDSYGSGSGPFLFRGDPVMEYNKGDESPVTLDRASDGGRRDDLSDRVYTIDAVHGATVGMCDDYASTPRESGSKCDAGRVDEEEIKKLYMRLQMLEADRESMRQAIISMGTDKAQMVLLKEIAQQLCKEVAPEKKVVKRASFIKKFSAMSVMKWITSVVLWRKKSSRIKYPIGLSGNNVGLLLLLDKSTRARHRRFLTRT
ncbi:myosin-binding protein 7 [Typha angustifolia]|uniref:myosin-binding protein 7 n=1 Tax=Typha angustifolia TaxID=59011 RepID=UPI003C2EC2E4